ncbi:PAS domain S-box protein [Flavivirga sp. 57AJ16]|uniref:sensor histidine kinase n=1 Tax=Flavivirga sp. 57AJ16 TaxID=3025307 RepID=UPI0023668631|nr:sensor histidine kinase [Flavivirga sp. 57AJ16]MDD7884978.1 PAS domain S-box protein [Flavivirga sp. 57AJ16]
MMKQTLLNTYSPDEAICLFNFVQEEATIGTWEVDLNTMQTTWSHVTKQIHEVDIEFEPNVDSAILFYKEGYSRDTITKLLKNCIEKFEKFDTELQIITAKGSEKWVRAIGIAEIKNGKAIRVCGAFQDIDEKTKVSKKIALREEQFRKTFESARIGMGIVSLDGKWIKVNDSICNMLGYTQTELLSIPYADITHSEDFGISNRALSKLIKGKSDSFEIQKRYIHKNGSIVSTILSIALVKNDVGKPIHFVYQISNITKIKKAKEKVNHLLEISEKQNKRLLNFAHIVSHDLRSHYSNLDMLLNIMKIDEPQATKNNIYPLIKDAIQHLGETLDSLNQVVILKSSAKISTASINLSDALKKSISSVNALVLKNKAIINIDIDKNLTVFAVAAYLDSILINLLTNSLKYKSPERQLQIDISAKKEGNYILINFKDNGLGIDLKLHGDKIFGMYKTFHNHKDSKGLGLFITKNQIEAIGGDINIESKVNVGTSFLISLKT